MAIMLRNQQWSGTVAWLRLGIGLSAFGLSVAAFGADAATTAPAASADEELQEVVVTGTLIRGTAPVGSNFISVGAESVQSQGATSSNELLGTIPQVTNLFNGLATAQLNNNPNMVQVVRPNLRDLSEVTGSTSATLVLLDGHRVSGVGVTQSAIDPDVMPVGAVERVEIVTDGGSATYGADAVGGVINFITRKRFNGVKIDARAGYADNYRSYDGNITAGKDWGSGSAYLSYMHQRNSALYGRDRTYIRSVDWTTAALTPIGRQCNPGNVAIGGTSYALPSLNPGFNACDPTDDTTTVPQTRRNSVLASLHQEFTSKLTLDARAFYGERSTSSFAPLTGTAPVRNGNFYYQGVTGNPTANQTVSYTFAPVLGSQSAPSGSGFHQWGLNAELGVKLTDKWRVTTLLNYSHSDSTYYIVQPNSSLVTAAGAATATTNATAVNFYNPTATTNLALIQAIANSEISGQGRDGVSNARSILEGSLFALPAGDVRMAFGLEYLKDKFEQRINPANAVRGAYLTLPFTTYDRNAKSAFGELNVPIVGDANRRNGVYALTLAASDRYDRFSDFGSTSNQKYGVTYKPFQKLALRANYSTSFNAPGANDQLGSLSNAMQPSFPVNAFIRPGEVPAPGVVGTLSILGSQPNLVPQTAKTYSYGVDFDPTSSLHVSVNMYHVDFKNVLGIPTPNAGIFTTFPGLVTTNVNGLTVAQLRSFESLAPNGAAIIEPIIAGLGAGATDTTNSTQYEFVPFLKGNYGALKIRGMDYAVSYQHKTGFGSMDAAFNGNVTLDRRTATGTGAPFVDGLGTGTSKLSTQLALGANKGHLRAQATVNYNSGYDIVRTATIPQDHVSSFTVVNLFFRYNVQASGKLLSDLAVTLNVNNALDKAPPTSANNGVGLGGGTANGFSIGRTAMLGVSKTF